MNEHKSPEFEARLHDLLAAPDADTAFTGRLRSTLIERSTLKTVSPLLSSFGLGHGYRRAFADHRIAGVFSAGCRRP